MTVTVNLWHLTAWLLGLCYAIGVVIMWRNTGSLKSGLMWPILLIGLFFWRP